MALTHGERSLQSDLADSIRSALLPMTRLARRLAPGCDAQDIVQDATQRALRTQSRYRNERGSPTAWLLTITASVARDAQRRDARRERLLHSVHDPDPPRHRDPDVDLDRAIDALPPRQRLAVHCFYYLDLGIAETARVMTCSEGTVKASLHKARATLRTRMGDDVEDR